MFLGEYFWIAVIVIVTKEIQQVLFFFCYLSFELGAYHSSRILKHIQIARCPLKLQVCITLSSFLLLRIILPFHTAIHTRFTLTQFSANILKLVDDFCISWFIRTVQTKVYPIYEIVQRNDGTVQANSIRALIYFAW